MSWRVGSAVGWSRGGIALKAGERIAEYFPGSDHEAWHQVAGGGYVVHESGRLAGIKCHGLDLAVHVGEGFIGRVADDRGPVRVVADDLALAGAVRGGAGNP